MQFLEVNPEVVVGLGEKTIFNDLTKTEVSVLNISLEDWLGDDLMEIYPCFIVTERLKNKLEESGFSGFSFKTIILTRDEYFANNYSLEIPLPTFYQIKITGKYSDDFSTAKAESLKYPIMFTNY